MKPSLAIAYAVKKAAHKKMARGGMAETQTLEHEAEEGELCAHGGPALCAMGCYAKGGAVHKKKSNPATQVMPEEDPMEESMPMMAEGGTTLEEEDDPLHASADEENDLWPTYPADEPAMHEDDEEDLLGRKKIGLVARMLESSRRRS